jgi:hypothetical protein
MVVEPYASSAAGAALPGYRVEQGPRVVAEEGLRNDVAGFLGSTERGPLNVAIRVEGRQAYQAAFGGPATGSVPRAVAAYFSNGGEVAWVVRAGRGGSNAEADIVLGQVDADGNWAPDGPVRMGFPGSRLMLQATSPGRWATGTSIRLAYRAYGRTGRAELEIYVVVPGVAGFRRTGLAADELVDAIASTGLVTAAFTGPAIAGRPDVHNRGRAQLSWSTTLRGGEEPELDLITLEAAVDVQAQIDEIALVCVPDLAELLGPDDDAMLAELARSAAASQDRMVVISAPAAASGAADLVAWTERIGRVLSDPALGRAVTAYAPRLLAENLAPTGPDRYSPTDPVGHVCGRIAELDRERGSGWSPANTLVSDAIDVAAPLPGGLQAVAIGLGVNLIRPRVGGGLEIWGAHTLDAGDGRYLAHRRIVHRIVRAARRVSEPLVFDTNGQLLWLSVARAISGVLMEAFRSGSLKGATPDQAYRVRCDDTTNSPEVIDAGQVVCEIDLAPATPMEFITLRLTIGAEGLLEVVEQ